jgi:CRP-like cAMP-binding protein
LRARGARNSPESSSFIALWAAAGNEIDESKEWLMDILTVLKRIYLFRDGTNEDLAALAKIAVPRKYLQGEFVFNEGDEADAIFVVEIGTVDIVPTGKELAVVSIGSGQALGEVAFFRRGQRPGSARAREMSSICRIPFVDLERLLLERPGFAMSFYRNACEFLATHLRILLTNVNRRYF